MTLHAHRAGALALGLILALSSAGVASAAAPPKAQAPAPQRRFTVADSIGLSSFTYPVQSYGAQLDQVVFSPDGKAFLAATVRGDLAANKREATLWLFDTEAVRRYAKTGAGVAPAGRVLVRLSSASDRDPIVDWRWAEDSRSVLFLGVDDDGARQLQRVAVAGGEPVALSQAGQDVSRYDESGGAIAYLAHKPIRAEDIYQGGGASLPDIEVATGKSLLPLVFPHWMDATFDTFDDELWTVKGGQAMPVLTADGKTPVRAKNSGLVIAPDGRSALLTLNAPKVPKSWEQFRPAREAPGLTIVADTPETEGADTNYRPQRYNLVDLATGEISVLSDSPLELAALKYGGPPRWSPDRRRIALVNVYPPFSAAPTDHKPGDAIRACSIMVVEIADRAASCVEPKSAVDQPGVLFGDRKRIWFMRWLDDRTLQANYVSRNAPRDVLTRTFVRGEGGWRLQGATAAKTQDLVIDVRQSLDEAPVLMARLGSGAWRALLDPNPQLKAIAIGKAAPYQWPGPDGVVWKGVLVTPPGYEPGRRYPLVVQTHGFDAARFFTDGPSFTGFAARAIAARDIVVLQVEESQGNSSTPQESPTGAAGYRIAVDQLAREGVIDRDRVGAITWSHMGGYVYQALVDDPTLFKATTFAEAGSNDYTEYLINVDYMGLEREKMLRAQVGPQPFGEGLKTWMEVSAGFRSNRICAPILWQVNSAPALMYGWGTYAALRAQEKPVDFLYIRNGNHSLVKPAQRLAEQGMNVDWYDFWLNDRTDPDPAKRAQFQRWARLKSKGVCGEAKSN